MKFDMPVGIVHRHN